VHTGWVSSAEYIDGTGMVDLCFDQNLKPFYLQLGVQFKNQEGYDKAMSE